LNLGTLTSILSLTSEGEEAKGHRCANDQGRQAKTHLPTHGKGKVRVPRPDRKWKKEAGGLISDNHSMPDTHHIAMKMVFDYCWGS
jgi:hypothetical protein